ncbi:MAG: SDR family NAD(P)-dependent oxidoreductase, partial [Streptomycetaceae bacterium]|nr:SDR family NAD(P)-dependent oxidoreductase [Streptomycetaceae bacterium]
ARRPRLSALSARTPEALREQVDRLARHCRANPDLDLGDAGWTLLLGRRHFQHRWARVVDDVAGLERALTGEDNTPAAGDDRAHVLAAEYLDGNMPDFGELFEDGPYRRVSLPTYAFDRTRYGLPDALSPSDAATPDRPLLTGDEFYLRDHLVRGTAIAPGAVYLHWAEEAVRRGTGAVRLHDVAFLRPLDVTGGPREVRVALYGDRFEVRSTAGGEAVTHCQGRFATSERPEPRAVDLAAMLRRFHRAPMAPDRFYAEYREGGIDFGPALRGFVAAHEADGEVLAELRLPEVVADTADAFTLHPSLVDSAMQCMRLLADPTGEGGVGLVFAIKEVEVLGRCATRMWAWVRHGEDASRIDLDLVDDGGRVCLALRGITGRRTEPAARATTPDAQSPAVTLLPVWDPTREAAAEAWPRTADSVGVIATTPAARDALTTRYPSAHVLTPHDVDHAVASAPVLDHLFWVAPEYAEEPSADRLVDDQAAGALQVFRLVKALLAAGYGNRALGLTLITNRAHPVHGSEHVDPSHAGVAGLAGAVAKEYPNWAVRVVDLGAYDTASLSAVPALPADPDGNPRLHRNGTWYRQRLMTFQADPPTTSRFREGGVYVVVGGAGGLGTALTEHLVRRHRAQVVWLGRSPRDARIDAAIAAASASGGPAPHYVRADATDADSLRQAREEVERRFGRVHGVIHSGLVVASASLSAMTEAEFHDVLRGKVDASVRLVDAFGGESLEVALFLSSINSYLKAIKQANYAAGCAFMDSFARTVERRWGAAGKVVNLGYCFNNAADGDDRATLMGNAIPLIQPDELVAAIELLCAAPVGQLTLMKFSPAINTRGMTVGDDEVRLLPGGVASPVHTGSRAARDAFDDLQRLRDRVKELTALAI